MTIELNQHEAQKPAALQISELGPLSLVVVVALTCLFCAALPILMLVFRNSDPGIGHLPFGPLVILAAICWVLAPLMRKLTGRSSLLVQVGLLFYCVSLGLGGFAGGFSVMQIAPNITAVEYFSTPENHFKNEIEPLIPDALAIKDSVIARNFYEGSHSGIPWNAWIGPVARWGLLCFLYFVTSMCMLGIFRKRWIHQERLPFPLAEIPLFIAARGHFGMARDNPRTRTSLLTIGLVAPLLFHSYNALHYYIQSIPEIPLGPFNLGSALTGSPWDAIAPAWTVTYFRISLVGIAYLMPSSMALGFFFFYLFFLFNVLVSQFMGNPTLGALHFSPYTSALYHQAGAYCGLFVFTAWSARRELAMIGRSLWDSISGRETQGHPDRWMLLGFIAGFTGMCIWAAAAGVGPVVAITFLLAALAIEFGFSLITAMSGLPILQANNIPQEFLTAFAPPKAIGMRNLVMIGLFERLFSWYKQYSSPPSVLQALRIGDSEKIPDRKLIGTLLVTAVLAIVINTAVMLHLGYNGGVLMQAGTWFSGAGMNNPRYPFEWAQRVIADPEPVLQYHWMFLGAISMWVMQTLYRQFVWWPIHPLGMLIPVGWQITATWFSVMIGWTIARAITKWAGPKTYVRARPLFLGLVIGDAVSAALWLVIDMFTGVRGHRVPTI